MITAYRVRLEPDFKTRGKVIRLDSESVVRVMKYPYCTDSVWFVPGTFDEDGIDVKWKEKMKDKPSMFDRIATMGCPVEQWAHRPRPVAPGVKWLKSQVKGIDHDS